MHAVRHVAKDVTTYPNTRETKHNNHTLPTKSIFPIHHSARNLSSVYSGRLDDVGWFNDRHRHVAQALLFAIQVPASVPMWCVIPSGASGSK